MSNIYDNLKKGDILLTHHSRNLVGGLIERWTGGEWTHAMIYAGEWHGHHMILESHYGGVKYTTLETYLKQGYKLAVLRSGLDATFIDKVISAAEEEIGLGYDYKGLVGYLWADVVWSITGKRKQYDDAEDRFCSELVKHHFEHTGKLDLTGKPSANTSPMDLYRSLLLMHIGEYEHGIRIYSQNN